MKNKLLITKGGALGDVLVSSAAIYEILQSGKFSEVEICGPVFLPQFFSPQLWKQISKIWVIDQKYKYVEEYIPSDGIWLKSGKKQSYWSLLHNSFDAIVNLKYESGRYIVPAFFAGIKTRIGSAPWYMKFLYTDCAEWIGLEPLIHERDRNFQVISAFPDFKNFQKKWESGELKKKGLPILWEKREEVLKKYNLSSGYILVNPTCSERYKAWQVEKFHELLKKMVLFSGQSKGQDLKSKIILVGTAGETKWLEEVRKDLPIKIVQPDSIQDLIQIVSHARLLVANASSMHYIATAQNTPAFVLYGAALPEVWGVLGDYSRSMHGTYSENIQDRKIAETTAFQSLTTDHVIETLSLYMKELGI